MGGKIKNISGRRFFRLKVLDYNFKTSKNKVKWLCECDCGRYGAWSCNTLTKGNTRSCGCLHKEKSSERLIAKETRHGMSATRTWKSWKLIKQRCYNEHNTGFKDYGGRGIKMSKDWYLDFKNFYNDMGECPEGYSIERIDNNGDYCKENCCWIPFSEQSKNRRNNNVLFYNGRSENITEWARILTCSPTTIRRYLKEGYSFQKFVERRRKYDSQSSH